MTINNDWIGFWGGYLGGLITLGGVFLTIQTARKDEITRKKLSIRPYITIEDYCSYDKYNNIIKTIGFAFDGSANGKDEAFLSINELILSCEIRNIGLGTAVNCGIQEFYVEEKKCYSKSKLLTALSVNGINYLTIRLNSVYLQKKDLSSRFKSENRNVNLDGSKQGDSKAHIKFELYFEDLLGNQLVQEFVFYLQINENIPVVIPNKAQIFLESINKPREV